MTFLSPLKTGLLGALLAAPMFLSGSSKGETGLTEGTFELHYEPLQGAGELPCGTSFVCPHEVLGEVVDFGSLKAQSHERPCRHSRCFGSVDLRSVTPVFADGVGWVELGGGGVEGCFWNTSVSYEATPEGVAGEVMTTLNGACLEGRPGYESMVLRQEFRGRPR